MLTKEMKRKLDAAVWDRSVGAGNDTDLVYEDDFRAIAAALKFPALSQEQVEYVKVAWARCIMEMRNP